MKEVDLLIVGAGPAGLSAACEAAKAGVQVMMIDENLKPGGQLFKQIHKFFGSRVHLAGTRGFRIGEMLLKETEELGVEVQLGYPVYGIFAGNQVLYGSKDGVKKLHAKKIILATGANENNLCFEGSILPGVMTAGAAQTMVNLHHVLPGQKVVMVGSGNVGLIVSYQLLQAGAEVVALVEAAPSIGGYGVHANKLKRAGVPIYLSHTIQKVMGTNGVEQVVLVELDEHFQPVPGTEKTLEADTVCMAVGLTPMTELAELGGCEMTVCPALGGVVPMHDDGMKTTNPNIYVAGDIAGVEEASTAMEEGRLAGVTAAGDLGFLEKKRAEERKKEIHERLNLLRSGQFGSRRADAKAEIEKAYESWEESGVQG